MPFFSVVIPCYNRERYLRATLKSALAQSMSDYEILVVDDQSTDGSVALARSFGPRVTVLEQPNQGPGAARNLGAARATGEYLAFLDSDDLWFPWTLQIFRDLIDVHNRPSLISGCPLFFENEEELAKAQLKPPRANIHTDYLAADPASTLPGAGLMVVRAAAFGAAGGFTSERVYCEDADLCMKLGAAPGFLTIREPFTVAYRRHASSAMHDTPRIAAGLEMMMRHEREGLYPGGAERKPDRRRFLAHTARVVSTNAAHSGLPGLSLRVYRDSFTDNLAEGRLRYLAGLPIIAAASAIGLRTSAGRLHGAGAARQSTS